MTTKQLLITKFQNKSATIGIIGLGYVGLPLSLRFTEAGYKVIGFDIDPAKTGQLNQGQSYIRHFADEKIKTAIETGFKATTDFSRASELESVELSEETLLQFDCVLLATDHDKFDYELIMKHSRLIVDSRGKFRVAQDHVFKA